jgi:hypothetical protein
MKTTAPAGLSRRNTFLGALFATLGSIMKLGAKSPEPKYIQHQWRQIGDNETLQRGDVWASRDPNNPEAELENYCTPGLTIQPIHCTQWKTPARARHGSGTCWRPIGSVPVFE